MKSKATAVRGSRTGRPTTAVLDQLGRRATLRLLWELREGRQLNFRALQEAVETNPSLLNTRLKEMRDAGWVEHDEGGYRLSEHGRGLYAALMPLYLWAEKKA